MEKPSAVVLLSSGLDSSFNLYKAAREWSVRLALTFNYGQKAAAREIASAASLAADLGIPHKIIDLSWFKDFTKTSLVGGSAVPSGKAVSIDDRSRSLETAKAVWVPNRNGIFLNIAAGFAEGLGCSFVVPGFNIEEASTFPDNSQGFLEALDKSFSYSTEGRVKTHCFSTEFDKIRIVAEGKTLGLPFARLWPCYLDGEKWCGSCESCQRFKRAVEANGLKYEELRDEG
jgi:7-cyano-7-deazaguanine synthase